MIENILFALFEVLALLLATIPHEIMHGYTAYLLGDNTAKWQGRLSFNPLNHINPRYAGFILAGAFLGRLIPALSFITSIFMWVGFVLLLKPVPINPGNFNDPKKGMAIVGLAGPLTNLVIAFISLILFAYLGHIPYLVSFLLVVASYNITLAVFNLIPIPPLDGSRVLFAFLPQKYYFMVMQYERYIQIIFLALVWFGVLDVLISNGSNNVLRAFLNIISRLPGVN